MKFVLPDRSKLEKDKVIERSWSHGMAETLENNGMYRIKGEWECRNGWRNGGRGIK